MPLGLTIEPEVLAEVCCRYQVIRLELFGSRARGDGRSDSDVDLLVTFADGAALGFGFLALAEALEHVFGRPVDLITRDSIETDFNPFRKQGILSCVETIYAA